MHFTLGVQTADCKSEYDQLMFINVPPYQGIRLVGVWVVVHLRPACM